MRVLTIVSKLEMGGIEKTLLSCLPYFRKAGVEIHVLCSLGGVLEEEYKKAGAILVDYGRYKKPFFDSFFLKKLLKNNNYDIVHSRVGHTSGIFAKVCYELKIPLIVSIHNPRPMFKNNWESKIFWKNLRGWYLSFHKELTLSYARRIVGHSKANLEYYIDDVDGNIGKGKFELIYNGIDFNKFIDETPLSPEKNDILNSFVSDADNVIVHIGGFKEPKNHKFLIDVFKEFNSNNKNSKLILLGTGVLLEQIKAKVTNLKLEQKVLFVGMEANIKPYLKVSNVFFFPSLYEGFGNVLIEAQYMHLPVCASRIKAHCESVYNKYHDFFYDSDNIKEATLKLEQILKERNSVKEEAFKFAQMFSVEEMAINLVKLYKDVLNERE